ncbi:MAG: hypothetical protein HRU07_05685 [Nitrosopumilus sp.]|nr:hypothetical protein [Nitrosopumilus sp.]NRA05637.1 hypothetical protein [Nitrosopumilus sp.]
MVEWITFRLPKELNQELESFVGTEQAKKMRVMNKTQLLIKISRDFLGRKSKSVMGKKQFTIIDYTLEQYFEEKKRDENIIKTLEKMSSVMSKFEKKIILDDSEIRTLKRKVKQLKRKLLK